MPPVAHFGIEFDDFGNEIHDVSTGDAGRSS
jgi:hypothetical protein